MLVQGAPLAYTPFCDNNKDMDGFRFWKQGFWKEHLRGRPYHISALYVVDLARFRCAPHAPHGLFSFLHAPSVSCTQSVPGMTACGSSVSSCGCLMRAASQQAMAYPCKLALACTITLAVQWRRQMAAGDQLRVVYDQLSRDPASLSNLDQDLPNYAQHQVPIFSLPQVLDPLSPANTLHLEIPMCRWSDLPSMKLDCCQTPLHMYVCEGDLWITFRKWSFC